MYTALFVFLFSVFCFFFRKKGGKGVKRKKEAKSNEKNDVLLSWSIFVRNFYYAFRQLFMSFEKLDIIRLSRRSL